MLSVLGLFSIGVFAITSVIATQNKNLDIFSVIFLAAVAALGGGTIRDIILGVDPIFWIGDLWFLWIVVGTALVAFFIMRRLSNRNALLLYLDALGISLFSITAAAKTFGLGHSGSVAVVMGLITAIFGSILRDLLAGSPSLLLRREMYATPVLLGLCIYAALESFLANPELTIPFCITMTFCFRAAAIHFHLQYPHWLCSR
ncbi:MAG: putative membrane protein YeiH [Cellvibrionaceae bacterium]|jgi:uncharacterized membrane protein YeiH